MRRVPATAKINLALVVGPARGDGRHEVATVLQRVDLADRIQLEPAAQLTIEGFREDTLVEQALEALAARCEIAPAWRIRIEKRIPVAAGLGGGSSDAAAALRLANETLPEPLDRVELLQVAASLGADVPFFLEPGPQLATGPGTELTPLELPQDYWIMLVLPDGEHKESTAAVYRAFDERDGADGYAERRAALERALAAVLRPRDLAALPSNDLAASPLAERLRALGAFRADVSGAGPVVYGLFRHRKQAEAAAGEVRHLGRTWISVPAWYF
jgi:4-diphosphocytidyl-2-C-methyl-D-erythritol kinase